MSPKTLILFLVFVVGCSASKQSNQSDLDAGSKMRRDVGPWYEPTEDASTIVKDAGIDAGDPYEAPKAGSGGTAPVVTGGAGGTYQAGSGGTPVAGSGGSDSIPIGGSSGSESPIAGSGGSDATPVAGSGGTIAVNDGCVGPPGLYASTDKTCTILADGVREYSVLYPLWTDGAIKHRYVYLPPGSKIDGTDPDHWVFPVGTRLYKEFDSPDSKIRVEIRYMEKVKASTANDGWVYDTYVWSADSLSPQVQINGVINAQNTGLDVPPKYMCLDCHNRATIPRDFVNGFQAIQLNHSNGGVTLQSLMQDGTLTNASATLLTEAIVPGRNATETKAFGWYMGNCGHCHTSKIDYQTKLPTWGDDSPHSMALQILVGFPLTQQPAWTTTICQYPHTPTRSLATARINPGKPYSSAIWNRDRIRGLEVPSGSVDPMDLAPQDGPGPSAQMPPIGTNIVDSEAIELTKQWITNLSVTYNDKGCSPN